MKKHGDFERQLRIQQFVNGYVVYNDELAGCKTKVFTSFEQAVDYLADCFALKNIGERVVLGATKENQEPDRQGE